MRVHHDYLSNIGFGLPTKQDTEKAHGEPPGIEELAGARKSRLAFGTGFYILKMCSSICGKSLNGSPEKSVDKKLKITGKLR